MYNHCYTCCIQPIQGRQGPSGPTGPSGSVIDGTTGPTGSTGPSGDTGFPGLTGANGLVGGSGSTGPIGPNGSNGLPGSIGPSGSIGSTGLDGPVGSTGITGATGATGIDGQIGDTGATGITGVTGNTGPMGPSGFAGNMGSAGATGITGPGGPDGPIGPTGPGPTGPTGLPFLVNIDLLTGFGPTGGVTGFDNVGVTGSVNVLTNDIIGTGVASVSLTAIPDPSIEGMAVITSPGGITTFNPAPRLLDTVVYGYAVTDTFGITRSTLIKGNVNLTYPSGNPATNPRFWGHVTDSNEVIEVNPLTGVTGLVITTDQAGNDIAANRGDVLLYYTTTGDAVTIIARDPLLNSEFTLISNVRTTFGLPVIYSITGLGFDQERYILYASPNQSILGISTFLKIAVRPYDRYNNPLVQSFTATTVRLPIVANDFFDLTVESSTGYVYATGQGGIYKINMDNSTVLTSVSLAPFPHITFANDNNIYIRTSDGNVRQVVNTTTLELGPVLSVVGTSLGDLSEPLYNF